MPPRKWSPPASDASRDPSVDAAQASPRSHWGALEYAVSFIYYMLFFGLIAGLLQSRFPIDLGLFLFFTNDGLIEWALRTVGIRLVPGSLGASFIKAFVWVTGVSLLITQWQGSAPAWLLSWLPPNPPWPVVAGAALGCAVLTVVSTAVVRRVLPWLGIALARDSLAWTITEGLVGFAMLGLMFLIMSTAAVSDWLGGP